MYGEVTITAVADRDPSCNLLTYTQVHDFQYHNMPTPTVVKDLCKEHKRKFLEMWPHNQAEPTLIPLDVTVKILDGARP
jgi:hypothetical protein